MKLHVHIAVSLLSTQCLFTQQPVSVADARKQVIGSVVSRVAGRVTANGQFRRTSYIEDRTGGIAVLNAAFRSVVQIGDSVVIDSARVTEFGQATNSPGTGLTELSGLSLRFTVVPEQRIEPTPRTTSIAEVAEGLEGQLVRFSNVKFIDNGLFQGETNYIVVDENERELGVWIDGATEIARNFLSIPTNPIDLIGIVTQFKGLYQITPRFATDVGLPPAITDTVNRHRTIDISTWNLNWYGSADTTFGPVDKERQRRSIRQVLDSIHVDLIAVQEVLSEMALTALSDSLDGSYGNLLAAEIPSTQKMGFIYNTATVTPISSGLAITGGAQAWAGGRFPFRCTFLAKVDGNVQQLVVFNIHAKATGSTTALEDYNRRKTDAEIFYNYLSDFYANENVIITGDFNDNLTHSTIDSNLETPYTYFINDTAQWFSPTISLEQRGLGSFVGGFPSFLDHFIISTRLAQNHYRTYPESPQAYLSSYSSTVSDHLPITMRLWPYSVTHVMSEINRPTITVRFGQNPCINHGTIELTVQQRSQVSVTLTDALGNSLELLKETLDPQIRLIHLPLNMLLSGVYWLSVVSDRGLVRHPIVILR